MPIYEYVCGSCGTRIDVIHPISGTGPDACAVCGGPMRKALTAPAIVFKGSGWAKKDFRDSTRKAASPSSDATAPGAATTYTGASSSGATSEATAPAATSTSSSTASGASPSASSTGTGASGGGSSAAS